MGDGGRPDLDLMWSGGLVGALVSKEVPLTGAGELPDVDKDLTKVLTARGASGVRTLGILQDACRVLTGTLMERPDEVAAACVRSAADGC